MGQSAGAGPTPSGGNNSSGGFGGFNRAAMQPNPGGFMGRAPQPMPTRAPANANLLDPQTLQNQATAMGRSMSGTPFGRRPDPSLVSTRPGAPMSLSGNAGPRPFMAQPPMYAMSTPSLNAPMYGRQSSPMPSSFASRLSALRGGMFGMPSNAVRFAEGGSTSAPSAQQMALGQALAAGIFGGARQQAVPQSSGVYRPTYRDYSAPGQPAGLGATPQYAQYQMQMPTFDRPSRGGDTRLQRPVPYSNFQDPRAGGVFGGISKAIGNLAGNQNSSDKLTKAIDSGTLTESQYNMILKDPSRYYSYIKGQSNNQQSGGYKHSIPMTTAGQRDAYNKRILRELDEAIRPMTVFEVQDYGGA